MSYTGDWCNSEKKFRSKFVAKQCATVDIVPSIGEYEKSFTD